MLLWRPRGDPRHLFGGKAGDDVIASTYLHDGTASIQGRGLANDLVIRVGDDLVAVGDVAFPVPQIDEIAGHGLYRALGFGGTASFGFLSSLDFLPVISSH